MKQRKQFQMPNIKRKVQLRILECASEIPCFDFDSSSILSLIYSMDFFNSSVAELRGMFRLRIVGFFDKTTTKNKEKMY